MTASCWLFVDCRGKEEKEKEASEADNWQVASGEVSYLCVVMWNV